MPEHHRANKPLPPVPPNPGRWPGNQFILVGVVLLVIIVFVLLGLIGQR